MEYTIEQLNKMMEENNGNLYLINSDITKLPDNLKVKGSLNLSNTPITKLPNSLEVNGCIDLSHTSITYLPNDLKVNGSFYLSYTLIDKLPDNLKVKGNLELSHTPITKLPDNLEVEGFLYLDNTKITKLPENLTIRANLYLTNTPIAELPDNLTVGGTLDLVNTLITEIPSSLKTGRPLLSFTLPTPIQNRLQNGTYVENNYLYVNNTLTYITRTKKINNYIYYIGKIKDKNVLYDGTNYSLCSSFKKGVSDLQLKSSNSRGSEQYKNISLTEQIPFDKAVTMYRIITGACEQGTSNFISNIVDKKDTYSPLEIAKITERRHGNDVFKKFFII